MPRKTKEVKQDTEKIEEKVDKKVAKSTTKKTTAVGSKTKKDSTKVTKKSTSTTKKTTSSTKKASDKNKALDKATKTSSKSVLTAKAKKSSAPKATSTTKKTAKAKSTNKTATKKTSVKSTNSKKSKKEVIINEYYDLPYRYNQTIVKILAQTPNNLFVYWDISDKDRDILKKQYGNDFFEKTRPVLIVHNDTLNYSFEVEINDFANSWYLHVSDSKCDYRIELGRRPIQKTEKLNTDYIYISASNEIESPNDRILFNKEQKMVYFRNVKTGEQTSKPINTLNFIRNMGKIYNIYDIYKAIYQDENIEELYDLSNPSSGNPSSR